MSRRTFKFVIVIVITTLVRLFLHFLFLNVIISSHNRYNQQQMGIQLVKETIGLDFFFVYITISICVIYNFERLLDSFVGLTIIINLVIITGFFFFSFNRNWRTKRDH